MTRKHAQRGQTSEQVVVVVAVAIAVRARGFPVVRVRVRREGRGILNFRYGVPPCCIGDTLQRSRGVTWVQRGSRQTAWYELRLSPPLLLCHSAIQSHKGKADFRQFRYQLPARFYNLGVFDQPMTNECWGWTKRWVCAVLAKPSFWDSQPTKRAQKGHWTSCGSSSGSK
jgi:hypothetical protein